MPQRVWLIDEFDEALFDDIGAFEAWEAGQNYSAWADKKTAQAICEYQIRCEIDDHIRNGDMSAEERKTEVPRLQGWVPKWEKSGKNAWTLTNPVLDSIMTVRPVEVNLTAFSLVEIKKMAAHARPCKARPYGSDDQVEAENNVFNALQALGVNVTALEKKLLKADPLDRLRHAVVEAQKALLNP